MADDGERVLLEERDGAVLVLTLNRPDRLNALSQPLREALHGALEAALADDGVRAIVLTGAGRAFCAGGDLDEIAATGDLEPVVRDGFSPLAELLLGSPKPVIAAVNGAAAGAGLGLALACDLRVMSANAVLAVAFAGIGLVPDTGVSWTLPRLVGPAIAFELCATGRRVVAEEALRLGLANRIAERDQVVPEARAIAAQLAAGPRETLAETKALLAAAAGATLAEALAAEAAAQGRAGSRPDFQEGVAAFRERRPPQFP